jgi:hypothetical protein
MNACGTSEHRNEQFENIENFKNEYLAQGNPILSMDIAILNHFQKSDKIILNI